MIEQEMNKSEHGTKDLIDISDETKNQLRTWLETGDARTAAPRGLYAQLPGRPVQRTEYYDFGCRGGGSRLVEATLDDTPIEVTQISRTDRHSIYMSLHTAFGNTATWLQPSELESVTFLQTPEQEIEAIDGEIKMLFDGSSFISLTHDNLEQTFDTVVGIRAINPLSGRAVVRKRNEFQDGAVPLDHQFTRIDVVTDSDGQQLVHIDIPRDGIATDWLRLEDVEFYAINSELTLLGNRLSTEALRLIQHANSQPDNINRLLEGAKDNIGYIVEAARELGRPTRLAEFVLARVTESGEIGQPFVPTLNVDVFDQPYIRASRVTMANEQPWIVNTDSQLATPLIRPSFKVNPQVGLYVPIESTLV